jgi:hypothetical protein
VIDVFTFCQLLNTIEHYIFQVGKEDASKWFWSVEKILAIKQSRQEDRL